MDKTILKQLYTYRAGQTQIRIKQRISFFNGRLQCTVQATSSSRLIYILETHSVATFPCPHTELYTKVVGTRQHCMTSLFFSKRLTTTALVLQQQQSIISSLMGYVLLFTNHYPFLFNIQVQDGLIKINIITYYTYYSWYKRVR